MLHLKFSSTFFFRFCPHTQLTETKSILDGTWKFVVFESKMRVLKVDFSKKKFLPAELHTEKTPLNRIFLNIIQKTNIYDYRKSVIANFESKWSSISFIKSFACKCITVSRNVRSEKSKKNYKSKIKEMQKFHERFPVDRKTQA